MNNLKSFLRSLTVIASMAVAGISLYLFYLENSKGRLFQYYAFSDLTKFFLVSLFIALVGLLIVFYIRSLMKKKYSLGFSFTFLTALTFLSIVLYSSMILSIVYVANLLGLALVVYFTKEEKPKDLTKTSQKENRTPKEKKK
jgi:amino acid transporter